MSAMLSFSATLIARLTKSAETKNLAYHHSGIAIAGLQEALGNFSQENSDAVFAASVLLAWQASDWLALAPEAEKAYTYFYSKGRLDVFDARDCYGKKSLCINKRSSHPI